MVSSPWMLPARRTFGPEDPILAAQICEESVHRGRHEYDVSADDVFTAALTTNLVAVDGRADVLQLECKLAAARARHVCEPLDHTCGSRC